MLTIWKYELVLTDVQKVHMPAGAELLHVAGQDVQEWTAQGARGGTYPMLWARVDTAQPLVDRLFGIVGTGNPAPAPDAMGTYVGTAICGALVWHVFDGGEVTG